MFLEQYCIIFIASQVKQVFSPSFTVLCFACTDHYQTSELYNSELLHSFKF